MDAFTGGLTTGCGTALVTPFRQDGSIDEQALYSLTQWQVESGINWLVACGTTAETPALDDDRPVNEYDLLRTTFPKVAGQLRR